MAAPILTISEYTRSRISAKTTVNTSLVKFKANQNLIAWEARAGGTAQGQGLLVGASAALPPTTVKSSNIRFGQLQFGRLIYAGQGSTTKPAIVLAANAIASFDVNNTELTQGDKTYRVTVYGKNEQGEWSAYG